jgi:hypothetical protein
MPSVEFAKRELQWRSWAKPTVEAFEKFCVEAWRIRTPLGVKPLELTEEQREAAADAIAHPQTIDLKARQIGFSTMYTALTFWECFFWPDRESAFFSIGQREAVKLMRMMRFGYRKLPDWVKSRGPNLLDQNLEKMSFSNDSQVESLPTGDDPGRGSTFFRVIFDEFASLPNQDEAYGSIEPTVDYGGRLNILSTAKGAGSLFERLFTEARRGENELVAHFNSWTAAKWRDEAWYEKKKRKYRHAPHQLHQEYPRDEIEAFVRAGNAVFNLDDLRAMIVSDPVWRGHLMVTEQGHALSENAEGDFCVWERPVGGMRYAIGADVARGLEIGDWSTAHVLRADTGALVARVRTKMEPEPWGRYLAELADYYNGALLGIENNTFGLSTNNAAAARDANLFRMRSYKQRSPDQRDEWGWSTNAQSKPLAISNLQEWLPDHNVPCDLTLHELRTYVFVKNGRMEGSPHDDLVMSLSIGVKMLEYVHLSEYLPEKKVPYMSFDWYKARLPTLAKAMKMGGTAVRG